MIARLTMALLVAVALTACKQKPPTQPPLPQTGKGKPDARLLEPERKALERAKGVESTVEQGTEERKQAIEKQTN